MATQEGYPMHTHRILQLSQWHRWAIQGWAAQWNFLWCGTT